MAENKNSFIAYCDWLATFEELPDDKAGQLAKHLFRYVNDLNPKTDDVLINAVFANIKQALKRDLKKYENYIEKQRENGKKGGRPPKDEESQKTQPFSEEPKKTDSVSDSVNVSDNDKDKIDFEIFWNAYDKKVGSKDKLSKKWNKLSLDEQSKSLQHIELYKIAQPDKQYRKNPETYLNNKSWNDEIIKGKNASNSGSFESTEFNNKLRAVSEDIFNDPDLK